MSFDRREVHLEIPVAPEMEIAATALVSALGEWMQMERDKIEVRSRGGVHQRLRAQANPRPQGGIDFLLDQRGMTGAPAG
jgi:hypothetical protein